MSAVIAFCTRHPAPVILAALLLTATLALPLGEFGFDAGTDTLVLESDPDLQAYDRTRALFGNDEYAIVSFARTDLFTPEGIRLVDEMTRALAAVPGVGSVMSLTNVRLFRARKGKPNPLALLAEVNSGKYLTLASPDADPEKARRELTQHRVYADNLVSRDGERTSLIVFFRDAGDKTGRRRVVAGLRRAAEPFRDRQPEIFLSGFPLIVSDMVDFMAGDMVAFDALVAAFFLFSLLAVFRRVRWVAAPVVVCAIGVLWVLGAMTAAGRLMNVVTANLSTLLFVIGMAHSIHLIEKIRESRGQAPHAGHRERIALAARAILVPCLYTATTTMAGCLSFAVTDSRPVIDFGVFLAIGVLLAFGLSFTLLPAVFAGFASAPLPPPREQERARRFLEALAGFCIGRRRLVGALSLAVAVLSALGIARIRTETRFSYYFPPESDVARGLDFIDRSMGGTVSFEVVLTGPAPGWFDREEGLAAVRKVQGALADLPEVGKVLSIADVHDEFARILKSVGSRELSGPDRMALIRQALDPATVSPYVTADSARVRVFARVRESSPTLERAATVDAIRRFVAGDPDVARLQPRVTGLFVLYTNMLETLVRSQVGSFALSFAAIAAMMATLFRSVKIGLISMVPNTLPILLVLGTMGWSGIHLDLATILIASLSLGIAVDGTIHYLFRFRTELRAGRTYEEAVRLAHASIGRPILFTTLSIAAGFASLCLSSFRPTAYLGLLTAVAMLTSLFAALTVLPACLLWLKPIPEAAGAPDAPADDAR